ncbi:hypothetical protein BGZ65_004109 [Modicella reniformis]|uniref:non-specific serine/threonine protein kinase n=1 Tax=Modicella reniformis TaxID=1440133 RepID=A0A9P6LZJ9_9FUNG|nr:hypothetical protein BGZ65_004109 [Modicella reniformis]
MNAVGLNMPQQGTILPGTTIQLGRFTVIIDRYIAEGGFAHVYLATLANGSGFPVVVKRIAVADKERLIIVNKEIETMVDSFKLARSSPLVEKRLGKHKNIVEYLDSCMGKLEGGGYEVLILMEYCGGGPVIDLMNRRLQHRLTEPEILKIFSNVCEAVAFLHYSDPPILHRDIKVENILLSNNDYKLCDFGSATTNILKGDNIPRSVKDIQMLEEEIKNHTTLQYRAPEMLDLYMRRGIDEKIDIWALGVLLYKLCYYTTPFEEQGQLAILNVRYTVPDYPVFSPSLVNLFNSMLKEDPRHRPNIYQVMKATSALRGLPCPIQNIYPETSYTPPAPESQSSATANILTNSAVARPLDVLPSIEPMRRGRPTRPQGAGVPVTQQNEAQGNPSYGFDDSFGQFTSITDPASQFSKISPARDAFDFEDSVSFGGSSKSDTKRFTLDFGSGTDDFGFNFSNVETKNPAPVASSTAPTLANRPRPPSSSGVSTSTKTNPTADELFFEFSANIQFESTDKISRSGTPLSSSSIHQTPIGLSSSSTNVGSQSSGMSKPLLSTPPATQVSGQPALPTRPNANHLSGNTVLNRNLHAIGTGNSRAGVPTSASSSVTGSDLNSRGLRSTNINNNIGMKKQDQLVEPVDSLELLQRQQLEQLGKFSLESGSALNPQNTQGKAKVLDLDRTLDAMKSLDISPRTGASSGSGSTPPALTPRPQVTPLGSPGTLSQSAPFDRKELAQRDLEAEKRLIELQQKEFEKQRQGLVELQRRELEDQQLQHRLQQEQLQKQQQEQIQLQHEKWLERKRMLKEQEQLTEKQLVQQRELQKHHESQQQLQQQQQQQQQQQLPDISNLAVSVAISLTTTDREVLASAGQQRKQQPEQQQQVDDYRRSSLLTAGTGQQATVIYPTAVLIGSRPSLEELSPSNSAVSVKSAQRPTAVSTATNGSGASAPNTGTTSTAPSTSSTPPTSSSSTTANVRARRISIGSLSPGHRPQLLPKPTRFRMKDGTGTLAAGEEEAFKKKFPSADLDDDLIQFQQPMSPTTTSSSLSGDASASFNERTQYLMPSQRAREMRSANLGGSGDVHDEEEEEEETLVRRRRPESFSTLSLSANGAYHDQTTSQEPAPDEGSESATPMESVRERVQRMNRVGRIS